MRPFINCRPLLIGFVWISWMAPLSGCGDPPTPPADAPVPDKDLVSFRLPESVTESAPLMQEHLYRLLPYNTSRFLIKPRFVFLEREDPITGPLDVGVTRLNLLHLCYWRNGARLWNASVLLGLGRSVTLNSYYGYTLDLITEGEEIHFTLKDGDRELKDRFHYDRDHERWIETKDARLYLNYYVFPQSLVLGKKGTHEKNESMGR